MCGKAIFEGIVTGICMAHERHLHGSRATLARLNRIFYVCKPLKFSIGKNSI